MHPPSAPSESQHGLSEEDRLALHILGIAPEAAQGSDLAMEQASTSVGAGPKWKRQKLDMSIPDEVRASILNANMPAPLAEAPFETMFDNVMEVLEQKHATEIHADLQKLSDFYFASSHQQLHTSKEALSQLLQMPVKSVEPHLTFLAQTVLQVERTDQAKLEHIVVDSGCRLIAYLEFSRYDETPMKVGHTQVLHMEPQKVATGTAPSGPDPSVDLIGESEPCDVPRQRTATVSKMFAIEHRFLIIFELPKDEVSPAEDGKVVLTGTSLVPLRLLDRATGPCIHRCLADANPTSSCSGSFPFKMRVTTTDQAQANFAAEKTLVASRGKDWGSLHLPCLMHILAKVITKSFNLCEDQITGVINLTLSLSLGAQMTKFREALAEVISNQLSVVSGHGPPQDAEDYRSFVMKTFCSVGKNLKVKQFLLQSFPNGDWRKRGVVEVYLPAHVQIDTNTLTKKLCKSLLLALTGSLYRVYPRHRWVGADASIEQIGLVEAIHGLCSAAYAVFLRDFPAGQPGPSLDMEVGEAGEEQVPPASGGVTEDFAAAAAGAPGAERQTNDGGAAESLPRAQPTAGVDDEGAIAWQELSQLNSRQRRKAQVWLQSVPLAQLIGMRLCLRPLCSLLYKYLDRSAHSRETAQRIQEAKSLRLDEPAARTFPLLDYLQLDDEKVCMKELKALTTAKDWEFVDRSAWTLDYQTLMFRMLSRLGAMVQELLIAPTDKFPLKFLQLFWSGRDGQEKLRDLKACCQDSFSSFFLSSFPGEQIFSDDADVTFASIVQQAATDTIGIEWGHGRVSRLLKASSSQTHTPSLPFLNGQFLAMKHKHRRQSTTSARAAEQTAVAPLKGQEDDQEDKVKVGKHSRGGGGAWRAFVSHRTKGQRGKADTSSLAVEYRKAKEDQSAEYIRSLEVGAAATKKHREVGGPSFGEATRAIRRRRLTESMASQRLAGAAAPSSSTSVQLNPPENFLQALTGDFDQQLRQIRSGVRQESKLKRLVFSKTLEELQGFLDKNEAMVREKILSALPGAVPWASSLHLLPQVGMEVLEVAFDSVDKALAIASWASANSRSSNLKSTLEQHWLQTNDMVRHSKQEELPPSGKGASKCQVYGHCFCDAEHKLVWRLRNRFLQSLKAAFAPANVDQKKALLEGYIVVLLEGQAPDTSALAPSTLEAAADLLGAETAEKKWYEQERVWLHIALMYLKPYRPTFQLLQQVQVEADGKVQLKQTGKFLTEFDLWFSLSLEQAWTVRYCRMLSTQAPVMELAPACCIVKLLSSDNEALWPLPARARRPRRARGGESSAGVGRSSEGTGSEAGQGTSSIATSQPTEEQTTESGEDSADEAEAVSSADEDFSEQEDVLEQLLEEVVSQQLPAATDGAEEDEDMKAEELDLSEVLPQEGLGEAPVLLEPPPSDQGLDESTTLPGGSLPQPAAASTALPSLPEPVPEPLPARGAPKVGPLRNKALLSATVEGGQLSYYPQGYFTATCKDPRHGKCVLTRTALGGQRPAQGRPLGLLVSWLADGKNHSSKEGHWNKGTWPDLDARRRHRALLAAVPGGDLLLEQERPLAEGEPGEPEERP